ncbi:MAG: hypothetical protein CFH21_00894 [Alphaproteobacteria bacterium MarineAlpha5_Bin11]|nr:MAG: hypothetical protein CFH21_00894 [Alphaproteobacteria bacterium MarineAlpha5_Bin11]|tara:strand:+ start:153 stop:497 length:345 start_codon:yes stop_codon:yes gene_type:complete
MNIHYPITSKFTDNKPKLYFSRLELNKILKYYSHGVSKGNWKDYAIQFKKDTAYFHFFINYSERPSLSILKQKKGRLKKLNYKLVHSNSTYIENPKLDNLFIYINRKNLKLIKK